MVSHTSVSIFLELRKACCYLACAHVGSTFVTWIDVWAGHDTSGSTNFKHLHVCEPWIMEERCFRRSGLETTFGFASLIFLACEK